MYKPHSLPKLPRKSCPYRVQIVTSDHHVKSQPCKHAALASGWCADHNYCHDILCLLSDIGFPALDINECLRVGRGVESWEDYICRLPAPGFRFGKGEPRYSQLLLAIQRYKAEHFTTQQNRQEPDERQRKDEKTNGKSDDWYAA